MHEAFLRLCGQEKMTWRNRAHFFAMAAKSMRRVLVDHARKRQRAKRGGGVVRIAFEEGEHSTLQALEVVALDDALRDLGTLDVRKAEIVELHFFAGLSLAETAVVVGRSTATVSRDWRLARAWLARALRASESSAELATSKNSHTVKQ